MSTYPSKKDLLAQNLPALHGLRHYALMKIGGLMLFIVGGIRNSFELIDSEEIIFM